MTHKFIITAILLNTSKAGITPKVVKSAKADEDFAGLTIECDDVIVDDISVSEVVAVNERILAVTYYVDVESDLPTGDVTKALEGCTEMCIQDDDFILINYSAVNTSQI